jgi:hypothetical protein
MSYSESNDQVSLTMSREDYYQLHEAVMNSATPPHRQRLFALWDRLNEGNPHYTPYQVDV